ncbi:uncharacterized protein [Porites lutea]|uniref:uncharacterized protein n=1 Tax=Porites lutea TaxID=51062 RepID=UPI003CC650A0
MAARNQLGRIYQPGKPLPDSFRGEILDLYNRGFSKKQISRDLQVTTRAVRKIIRHFQRYGTLTAFSHGGSEPRKVTDNVLQCMEIWKLQKPTTYAHEIRNRLYLEGICDGSTLPSESSIQHSLHDKLGMTRKKVCQIPTERAKNIWKVDDYLQITQGLSPTTLHFFDEASVVKTTSNRLYGSSYRGMKAVEVQRYASNATYTVNLLHSVFGVDYYNIIPGASNGEELIAFFDYALECERSDGLPVFLEGDTLIMDNCGFHHGRTTERALRTMFATRGVTLLFQPPYSPNLNTCEYCFHQMKEGLRQNEHYSQECTEMAIMDSLNSITATQSVNYFRHCGYLY